jgi:drug/metabolite transporter (DMT)-like permease
VRQHAIAQDQVEGIQGITVIPSKRFNIISICLLLISVYFKLPMTGDEMDILMGLLAAIFWGGTDFLVGLNARLLGVKRAVFFGQLIGFMVMTLVVLCFFESMAGATAASFDNWLAAGLTAVLIAFGALTISKAFALGKASIIAPVVTCYGIVTTALSWLSGESISVFQFAGILVCVVGVGLAGLQHGGDNGERRTSNVAILYALLAAILYGAGFWLHGHYALPVFGPVAMLWMCYAVGLLVLSCFVINVKTDLALPSRQHGSALIGASLLNLAGFFAFATGAVSGSVSIVTVISTLSGGVAAILGVLFFNERLTLLQVTGVLLVLFGAVTLHLGP